MNKTRNQTKFRPTEHAIEKFRERFCPDISDEKAAKMLREIARGAKPLTTQKVMQS